MECECSAYIHDLRTIGREKCGAGVDHRENEPIEMGEKNSLLALPFLQREVLVFPVLPHPWLIHFYINTSKFVADCS